MVNKVHQDSIGTIIELTVMDSSSNSADDIASATVTKFVMLKPKSREVLEVDAEFSSNGTDGKLKYTTVEGDLDESGIWKIQVYIESPQWIGYTDQETFIVYPIID